MVFLALILSGTAVAAHALEILDYLLLEQQKMVSFLSTTIFSACGCDRMLQILLYTFSTHFPVQQLHNNTIT